MDYQELLALAEQKQTDLLSIRSRNARPGGASKGPDPAAIAAFKARREREERERAYRAQQEKEYLLSLRAQSGKSSKKAKAMTARTRENDFSRIAVNESEVKDSERVEEKIRRSGIRGTKERIKARLQIDERLATMTRRDREKAIAKLERDEPVKVELAKKTSVKEVLAKAKEAAAAKGVKKSAYPTANPNTTKRRSVPPPPALSYDQLLSMANENSSKKPMSLEEHIKAEMEQKRRDRPMTAKEKEQAREEMYYKSRSKGGSRLPPTEAERAAVAKAAEASKRRSPSPSPSPEEVEPYEPYEPEKVVSSRRFAESQYPMQPQQRYQPKPSPYQQQTRKPPPPPPPPSSRAPPERYSPTNARLPGRAPTSASERAPVNGSRGSSSSSSVPYRPSAPSSRPPPPAHAPSSYTNGYSSSARPPPHSSSSLNGRQRPPPPPQQAARPAYSSQRPPPAGPSSARGREDIRGRMPPPQTGAQNGRDRVANAPPPPASRGRPSPGPPARYEPRGGPAAPVGPPYRPSARPPPAQSRYSPPPGPRTKLPPIGATYRRGMYNDYEPERYGEEEDEDEYYDDEEEDEMADFIDDGPETEEYEPEYSSVIRDIFGYDKRKYRYIADDDDDIEEASFAQCMKEEKQSLRAGIQEDLEDIRREEEELRAKAARKKAKRK